MAEIKGSVVQRARNEVQEERNEKAVEALKKLYRQEADAQDVLDAIKRKIKVEESKLT